MLIQIDRTARDPLYQQIIREITALIDRGDLEPGSPLPSSRRLAAQLGVDRTTVCQAYGELQALGFLVSRPGSYNVVQRRRLETPAFRGLRSAVRWAEAARPEAEDVYAAFKRFSPERPSGFEPHPEAISLSRLDPDPRLFPLSEIHRVFSRTLWSHADEPFQYGHHQGYPPLRDHLAQRLRLHGIAVSADEILITNGAQQALDLVIRLLARPGREVVIESPTYAQMIPLLRLSGAATAPVPMREDGMDLDVLEKVLDRDRTSFVYTMPNFQNPTGITTGHGHRRRLLDLCASRGVPILEDGFEEDMKYFGRVDLPIKSMDDKDIVIYVGTFSKALFPGLRVGWAAADRGCIERLLGIKRFADLTSNHLAQVFMFHFCREGHYDRHLRRLHRAFRKRLALALETIEATFPRSVSWTRPPGGYTIWVRMARAMSQTELDAALAPHGVEVSAGQYYFPNRKTSAHFRICIARLDEREIREGITRLGRALSAMERS